MNRNVPWAENKSVFIEFFHMRMKRNGELQIKDRSFCVFTKSLYDANRDTIG